MRTNLLVREQRVVCTFPSGRDIVLSRVAGFSSQGRRGETLLINYMAVFTQQGFSLCRQSSCLVKAVFLLFIYYLDIIYFQRELRQLENICVCMGRVCFGEALRNRTFEENILREN